jgi:putative copper export protein
VATDSPLALIGRWLLFSGTLLWVGAATVRWGLLPLWSRGAGSLEPLRGALTRAATRVGVLGGLFLLAGVVSRLQTQVADFVDPFDPAGPQVHVLLTATLWGKVWIAQALLTGVGLLAFVAVWAGRPRIGWGVAGVAAVGVGAMPALSGHAIGTEGPTALAVMADVVHVWAAGASIGGLLVVVAAVASGRSWRNEPAGRVEVARLIGLFSPLALAAGGALVVTGVFATWLHLSSVEAFLGTGYGLAVRRKLVLVALLLGAGAYNWRRVKPRLPDSGGTDRLLRSAILELMLAGLVLLVTAVLVVTSPDMDM